MKFEKAPAFEITKGSFATKTKLRTPKTQISIYFQIVESKGTGRKKRTSNLKKRTKKQDERRLIFTHCDCLYKLLKQNYEVLHKWFEETATGEWKKKGLRSYFMYRCLKFDIGDLLSKYLGLTLDFIVLQVEDDEYTICTKVIQDTDLILSEERYKPSENRLLR